MLKLLAVWKNCPFSNDKILVIDFLREHGLRKPMYRATFDNDVIIMLNDMDARAFATKRFNYSIYYEHDPGIREEYQKKLECVILE